MPEVILQSYAPVLENRTLNRILERKSVKNRWNNCPFHYLVSKVLLKNCRAGDPWKQILDFWGSKIEIIFHSFLEKGAYCLKGA
jgi:hypothetical protein